MEYSSDLILALRKHKRYTDEYNKYKTIFFLEKLNKWRARVFYLYRIEWAEFCEKKMEQMNANIPTLPRLPPVG